MKVQRLLISIAINLIFECLQFLSRACGGKALLLLAVKMIWERWKLVFINTCPHKGTQHIDRANRWFKNYSCCYNSDTCGNTLRVDNKWASQFQFNPRLQRGVKIIHYHTSMKSFRHISIISGRNAAVLEFTIYFYFFTYKWSNVTHNKQKQNSMSWLNNDFKALLMQTYFGNDS